MALFSLGPLNFMSLTGTLAFPSEKLMVAARPGVKGLEFVNTNGRPEPSSLISLIDVANYAAGLSYFWIEYRQAITKGLLDLTVAGFPFTLIGIQAKVRDVRYRRCLPTPFVIGGLSVGTQAVLEAEWELFLLETPSS